MQGDTIGRRGWEEKAASLPCMKTQRDHLTLQSESLPHRTKGKSDSCVKTLDDSLFGASLVKCNFRALSGISNKNLAFGASKMRIVFILFVDLTEVGKEMKFLWGYLGEGFICFKVNPWLQRGSQKPCSPPILHCGVWKGGGWGRLMGERSLSWPLLVRPIPRHLKAATKPSSILLPCFNFPPLFKQSRGLGF